MTHDPSDRVIPPSPRRREEARREGRAARSRALTGAAVLTGFSLGLLAGGGRLTASAAILLQSHLSAAPLTTIDAGWLVDRLHDDLALLATGCLGLLAVIVAAALIANLLQVGILWTLAPLLPRWERFDPGQGLRRILSTASVEKGVSGGARLAFALVIAGLCLADAWPRAMSLAHLDPEGMVGGVTALTSQTGLQAALVLLATAGLEYLYLRWRHEQSLWLTPDEARDEQRASARQPAPRAHARPFGNALSAPDRVARSASPLESSPPR